MNLKTLAANAAGELERIARNAAEEIATTVDTSRENALAVIAADLHQRLRPAGNSTGAKDGRAKEYRYHMALYNSRNQREPIVDSQTEQPEGEVLAGLVPIAKAAREALLGFHAERGDLEHGGQLIGFALADMQRSVDSLRPTISRRKARGLSDFVWKIKYQTADNVGGRNHWILRLDITPLED